MMVGMERFVDDDPGYLYWLAHHSDGFVINTGRTPTAAYLMLHRAGCGTINGRPARGTTFTGDYAKVCGDREELEESARQLLRSAPVWWQERRRSALIPASSCGWSRS
jgi:hypothetical protein